MCPPVSGRAHPKRLNKYPREITLAVESHFTSDLPNTPFRLFHQHFRGAMESYVPNVFRGGHPHHPGEFPVQVCTAYADITQ